MGSSVFYYYTPFEEDIEAALQALREREFAAGRYDPAMRRADPPMWMWQFKFPPDETSPAPGPVHGTLAEATFNEEADGTGTRSILDLFRVMSEPEYCAASPFTEDELSALFGTTKPAREQIIQRLFSRNRSTDTERIMNSIERGQGRYIVLYTGDVPTEIFFIGYSFD